MDDKERSEKIYNTWKDRVFRVEGRKLNGSGIALGRKRLLTAAHMGFKLKDRYSLHGTNGVNLSAAVEYINRKADFALLQSDELPEPEIERRNLDVGRNYFLMGYPSDVVESAPSISKGIIENFHADKIHLVGSPGVRFGYSGGPVFDKGGALTALLIGGRTCLTQDSTFKDMFTQPAQQNNVRLLPMNVIEWAIKTSKSDEDSM